VSHPIGVSWAHPPCFDHLDMERNHHRYEIRVAGSLGDTILAAFPELDAETERGQTILTGKLPDRSALYGIVARLESLGLELVDLRRLSQDAG
jgi:hypothetical protein